MAPTFVSREIKLSLDGDGNVAASIHSMPPTSNLEFNETLILSATMLGQGLSSPTITTVQLFSVVDNAPAILQAIWVQMEGGSLQGTFLTNNTISVVVSQFPNETASVRITNVNISADPQQVFIICSGWVSDLDEQNIPRLRSWILDPEVILRSGQGWIVVAAS